MLGCCSESGEQDPFSGTMVHYKIDNLKCKARDQYKTFQRGTTTGNSIANPGSDAAYDLEGVFANWANFRVWHANFKDFLGSGTLSSRMTATIDAQSTPPSKTVSPSPSDSSLPTSAGAPGTVPRLA